MKSWNWERKGQLVVGIDPGEHSGFCVVYTQPVEGYARMPRSHVLFSSPSFEHLAAYLAGAWDQVVVLVEDQYKGKASAASRTTLSQRAGFLAGSCAALGVPLDNIVFVAPQTWYKHLGCPRGTTKDVCLARVERNLSVAELMTLEVSCGPDKLYAAYRLDVLAAIGIAWSYPFLTELELKRGRKLLVMGSEPKKPRKKQANRKRGQPLTELPKSWRKK